MGVNGIYGLSGSGIDIESMVKVGMMGKQKTYDKMYKENVKNEWMKEAYVGVYNDMTKFNVTTLSDYKMSSCTSPMNVANSDSSVVTATANADAAQMTHTVKVDKLTSNAYLLTKDKIHHNMSTGGVESTSIHLMDVMFDSDAKAAWQQRYNDGDIDANSPVIEFELDMGDDAEVENGSDGGALPTKAKISFTYAQIFEGGGQTLNDLAVAINNSKLNVKASYDATNDAFSIYQTKGGEKNEIKLSLVSDSSTDVQNASKALLNNLHLAEVVDNPGGGRSLSDLKTVDGTGGISAKGVDGQVTIDGREYKTTTGKISVGNVFYTLGSVGTSTVSVSQDTDKLVENVKAFVEDYNKMMDSLIDKFNEKQYKDYGVLTKSQEEGMTKEQVTKWNEKAKSGLLYHDKRLNKLMSEIREAFYTPVENTGSKYNTMMSLGIKSSTDQGHITLDEEKLRKALAADPECVSKVFAASGNVMGEDGKLKTDYSQEGVLNRISDKINTNLKELKTYAGVSTEAADSSKLGDMIMQLRTKMSDFKKLMSTFEKNLYDKYDAMEMVIQRQSVYMNYIAGGN